MEINFCGECGTGLVSKNAKLCVKCGADPHNAENYCVHCGEKLKSKNAALCLKCGSEVKRKHASGGLSDNYSCWLYLTMAVITAGSFLFSWCCSVPGIFIALLFLLLNWNDKVLVNNVASAALLMAAHIVLAFLAALSIYFLVGIILFPLEVLLFFVVYVVLTFMAYSDRNFAPIRILQ